MNAALTLDLIPGRDYVVLRGEPYEEHDGCFLCRSREENFERPALHTISGRLHAPPLEVALLAQPPPRLLPSLDRISRLRRRGFGNILGDIFDFIASIIQAILAFVGELLARIAHDLLHPLDGLKDLIQLTLDVMTGAVYLKLIDAFPLTHWMYEYANWLTGGFVDNLMTTLSLPGKFFSGQPVTRADLIKALGVVIVAIGFAITFLTGGLILAIIGLSVNLLKGGPIGKTALGRTILDIAGIGMEALCGGDDLVGAFVDAGQRKLQGTAEGALANKLHLSNTIVGLVKMGEGAITGDGDDEGDDEEDESGNDSEDSTSEEDQPSAAVEESASTPASDDLSTSEEAGSSTPASDSEEEPESSGSDSSPETSEDSGDDTDGNDDSDGDEDNGDEDNGDDDEDNSDALAALKAAQLLAQTTQKIVAPVTTQIVVKKIAPKPSKAATVAQNLEKLLGIASPGTPAAQKQLAMIAGVSAVALLFLMKGRRS